MIASETITGAPASSSGTITGSLDTSSVTAKIGSVNVSASDSPTLTANSTMTPSSTASPGGVAGALSGDGS